MTRKDVTGIFLLVSFALVTAFFYHSFLSPGMALQGQWDPDQGVVKAVPTRDADSSMEILNPDVVRQMVQKKEWIILDVRPGEIYDQGHLPHAVSFPLMAFDEALPQFLTSTQRSSDILVYCASIECTDSHTVAGRLKNLGYTSVKVFSGGFRQWQEKGYEIEKNED
ncbi:rhodanese-like domain-containing protein [Desulfobacula sp.]|uniref:rhodanese-like domain-containing protein n=1 Tax=Desulfobacula sp. TaxID=2593537 RepID=UPI0026251F1D|nr:rhodanese-like domain-containing protein [Desulfobacula sp.]